MTGENREPRREEFLFDVELEAAPETVWRAVQEATFRRQWLPDSALADPKPVSIVPGREICYRMLDDDPPFFESLVTFEIHPNADQGTLLRIVHRLTSKIGRAANDNGRGLMRAA